MKKNIENKSSLRVNQGVVQPPAVNPHSLELFRKRRKSRMLPEELRDGILAGNISCLSQAITLVESSLPAHQEVAVKLVEECLPFSGKSVRIGITGVPGVGKSSFIESFGLMLTDGGSRIAVLAVDPSSTLSRGSILGDKTRMEELSANPSAFIRPSPSGGSLGGVAGKTRESIILCEAAGFDTIIVETVGVGQSETAVRSMVDYFLLLMLAGAGDELQGIKRGIMEMADGIAITKSDGSNISKAALARIQYENALRLFPSASSCWNPRVHTCSALERKGLEDIYESLMEYVAFTQKSGYFEHNRMNQALYWMQEKIDRELSEGFYRHPVVADELGRVRKEVKEGRMSSFSAAKWLMEIYLKKNG